MRRLVSFLQATATTLGVAAFYLVPFVLAGMSSSPLPEWEMDVSYGTRDASFVHVTLESIVLEPPPEPPPEPPVVKSPEAPRDRSSERSTEKTAEEPVTEAEVLTSVTVPDAEVTPMLEMETPEVVALEDEGEGAESAGEGRRRRRRKCIEPTEVIQQTSEGRFIVERTLVDRYAHNLRLVKNLGRARWQENDHGKRVGFRVRRIRCGSVLYEAGLRNGDIVHAINGHTILSLAQAIPLWWNLRGRDRILVRLTRQGETMRLRYRLV